MTDTARGRATHIHTRDLAWGPPEPAGLGPGHDATNSELNTPPRRHRVGAQRRPAVRSLTCSGRSVSAATHAA
jgi:hypothetical protein